MPIILAPRRFPMPRPDGREPGDLRPISFQRGFTSRAPGSVLATLGNTRVLCTAMATDGVPPFLQGKGRGWLTAEYSMLPSSTEQRKSRDRVGSPDGRSIEIDRKSTRLNSSHEVPSRMPSSA